MHAQDAVFSSVRLKDPNALLTLPEFIREAVPRVLQPQLDPNALLTLDEAAREHPAPPLTPGPHTFQRPQPSKGLRNRSMSAPALSWLLPVSSKSAGGENVARSTKDSSPLRPSSAGNDGMFVFPRFVRLPYRPALPSIYGTTSVVRSRAP